LIDGIGELCYSKAPMHLKGYSPWSARIVLLAWVSLWMLVAPLVHIHPEADHRHGTTDHVHGGMVHTVFSTDLTCEFSAHDHASVADNESLCPLHLLTLVPHGLEHLEIDLVFASSSESQSGKSTALDVAARFFHANPPTKSHAVWQPQPSPSPTIVLLETSLSSRAPPTV